MLNWFTKARFARQNVAPSLSLGNNSFEFHIGLETRGELAKKGKLNDRNSTRGAMILGGLNGGALCIKQLLRLRSFVHLRVLSAVIYGLYLVQRFTG